MAYRRRRRNTRRVRRKAPRRLSKHMVRAIKAISQGPIETKRFTTFTLWNSGLVTSGYISGPTHVMQGNIFSGIPKIKNSLTRTEDSVIGNEFLCRGFKFMLNLNITTANAFPDVMFRFGLMQRTFYSAGVVNINPGGQEFDQDFSNVPTQSIWNTQVVKRMYSRKFRLNQSTTDPGLIQKKFYIPLRKKVVSSTEESLAVNDFVGQVKGMQYYWTLEVFGLSITALDTAIAGNWSTALYFKDP